MGRQVAGELLRGRSDAQEHDARSVQQLSRAHADQSLLPSVLQGPRVEGDVEGPRDVRGGATVRLTQEAVPLEAADIAADRHLRDAQLARQLGDVDRLLRGDARQDPMPPIDGVSGAILWRASSGRRFLRHRSLWLTKFVDEKCSIVFDYRRTRGGVSTNELGRVRRPGWRLMSGIDD